MTLPMLAGIALGRWIDSRSGGPHSFTIMLLVGGLLLGCVAAYGWVRKRLGIGGGSGRTKDPGGKAG